MSHARLVPGAENSGKLVTYVRQKAEELAQQQKLDWILIDGPPGIGCPAIAALTGVDAALIVAEPTVSGLHDMERIATLIQHFQVPAYLCVNKWDLSPELTEKLQQRARSLGIEPCGQIRYDMAVVEAMVRKQTVVEYTDSGSAEDLRQLHLNLRKLVLEKS